MTIKELHKLTFDEAIEKLQEETNCITTIYTLKDFTIKNINKDNIFLSIHILQALQENNADYYNYDYYMGTLDTLTPIKTLEDLEDFCEEGEIENE